MINISVDWEGPSSILNSECRDHITLLNRILLRLGRIQNIVGVTINPRVAINQFNDKFIDVAGSKAENMLVIMFSFLRYLLYF